MKRFSIIVFVFFLISCSRNKEYNEKVAEHSLVLIGKAIPAVALEAYYQGKIQVVDLQNYRGKWLILFFYPGDFTFVCPTELKELSDYYDEFKNDGAEIISISTDSAYVHKAWKESTELLKNISFPMASDRAGTLARAFGIYDEQKGEAMRGSFIVNPQGIIVAYEVHTQSIGRSAGELLRKLDAAIATHKEGGVCPASWKKGDSLIFPTK